MALGSLVALLDDIATTLDDIAVMTKTAATKTAGVAGDDLAVGAGQVTGSPAEREIPIVMKVMKGSFINKLIIVPIALLISAVAPMLINYILMLGGMFLSYEGAEKVMHKEEGSDSNKLSESDKVKGAIATDLVLSTEIIVIALAAVASLPFMVKAAVLSLVAIVMTLAIYLIVMLIVKLDDMGLYLTRKFPFNKMAQVLGMCLITAAPKLMRFLAIAGTAAMLGVAGSIFTHTIPWIHHVVTPLTSNMGDIVKPFVEGGLNVILGIVVGGVLVLMHSLYHKLKH